MILYNPEWSKRDNIWTLLTADMLGKVRSQITRDYAWEVFEVISGKLLHSGTAPDRIAAYAAVEKILGYKYFVEPEYEMERGCRCGSCTEATGRWQVYTRDDSINEYFASESEAISWIVDLHATDKKP